MIAGIRPTVVVVVIASAIWLLFYVSGMPLDSGSTAVVVFGCALLVLAAKAILQRVVRKRPQSPAEKPPADQKTASSRVPGALLLALGLFIPGSTSAAELFCSSGRPVYFKGETAELRAWASTADSTSTYMWSAAAGKMQGRSDTAAWDLSGVSPGRYTATVTAKTASTSESCSIEIFYQNEPLLRGSNSVEAGRFLLAKGATEPSGYGLYSYLLFGEPTDDRNLARYSKALQAFSDLVLSLDQLESYFDRQQLNLFSTPVLEKPKAGVALTVPQMLKAYDFARARYVLNRVSRESRRGPYLVSSLVPLGAETANIATEDILIQDLSGVPPELVDLWVREFLTQAAQRHSWNSTTFRSFLLRTRTVIEVLAKAYPQVTEGLATLIQLVDKPK